MNHAVLLEHRRKEASPLGGSAEAAPQCLLGPQQKSCGIQSHLTASSYVRLLGDRVSHNSDPTRTVVVQALGFGGIILGVQDGTLDVALSLTLPFTIHAGHTLSESKSAHCVCSDQISQGQPGVAADA